MNNFRIGKDGNTSEMGELVEDAENQWCNLERKFGFVKLEKMVPALLQVA